MKKRLAVLCCAALAAGSLLAACSDDEPTVAEAKEDFCQAVADVAQQEEALGSLNAQSSVDDAKSAVSDLEDAVKSAKDAAEEVGQAEADALQSAYDDLKSSIDDISGSDTLAAAAPAVVQAKDTFKAQWDAIRSKNCGGAVASTTTTTSG
jgi:hypothetical protein